MVQCVDHVTIHAPEEVYDGRGAAQAISLCMIEH